MTTSQGGAKARADWPSTAGRGRCQPQQLRAEGSGYSSPEIGIEDVFRRQQTQRREGQRRVAVGPVGNVLLPTT
jgi:hypothetical protein